MKRRRKRSRAQRRGNAVPKSHHLEPLLKIQRVAHADAAHEVDELIATRQEYVLPVVDLVAVNDERGRAATEKPAAFEEFDGAAGLLQGDGGGKPRQPGSDDRYTGRSQEPTITSNFSDGESEVLPRSGNAGSRSIFSRMRS